MFICIEGKKRLLVTTNFLLMEDFLPPLYTHGPFFFQRKKNNMVKIVISLHTILKQLFAFVAGLLRVTA